MWLVVRSGPDAGAAVEVTKDAFVVGRQQGCDLVVRDARASRRHAELRPVADGGMLLRDLGSANGTWVDASRVEEAVLRGGEEIRIGDTVLELRRAEPPLSERAAASPVGDDVPTYSAIRRLVDTSTRRARRGAVVAAVVVAAAVAVAVGFATRDEGGQGSVPDVVRSLGPATVRIDVTRAGVPATTGSGWVLDAQAGLVVTSQHVLNEGDGVSVRAAGTLRSARVVAAAPCEDLAVVRVADPSGLRSAALGTDASVERGETVVALGFPAGSDTLSATTGVVSAPDTALRDPAPDVPAYPAAVQTDTALNPGNSGGPLADLEGRVIGVNAAARTRGAGGRALQNVNFAIAIDRARRVVGTLREGRGIAWTGLTFGYPTPGELRDAGLPAGLRVTGAFPGTPGAEALDEVPPGSVVAGIDGRPITATLASYCDAVGNRAAGEQVVLQVAQRGRSRTRPVRIRLG